MAETQTNQIGEVLMLSTIVISKITGPGARINYHDLYEITLTTPERYYFTSIIKHGKNPTVSVIGPNTQLPIDVSLKMSETVVKILTLISQGLMCTEIREHLKDLPECTVPPVKLHKV